MIWPTILDFYVYGEPIMFSYLLSYFYFGLKREARRRNRRLILEQPS